MTIKSEPSTAKQKKQKLKEAVVILHSLGFGPR